MAKSSGKPNNPAPWCCGEQATWVNMGKWMEYWYCKKCKKEVKDEGRPPFGWRSGLQELKDAFSGGLPSPTNTTFLKPGEGVMTGLSPCRDQNHYWPLFANYTGGHVCNCGGRRGYFP